MKKDWIYKNMGDVCAPKAQIKRAAKQYAENDEINYIDISSIDNVSHSLTDCTKYKGLF